MLRDGALFFYAPGGGGEGGFRRSSQNVFLQKVRIGESSKTAVRRKGNGYGRKVRHSAGTSRVSARAVNGSRFDISIRRLGCFRRREIRSAEEKLTEAVSGESYSGRRRPPRDRWGRCEYAPG